MHPVLPSRAGFDESSAFLDRPSSVQLVADQPVAAELLVARLGRALHRYGSPAHRLEEALATVALRLGLEAQVFSTPTALFASYRPLGSNRSPRTLLERVEPGDADLEMLSSLDALLGEVGRGEISADLAIERIEALEDAPARYGPSLTVAAFSAVSGSAARFFGGGLLEIVVSLGIGFGVGLLAIAAPRRDELARLFEGLAALLAATAAGASASMLGTSFPIVTVAALIVLVPGLTLTVAMTELATRNQVSGAARLAAALLLFLMLGLGSAAGRRLAEALFGEILPVVPVALPPWTEIPALGVASMALLVLFRAAPRDLGWFLAASAVAYGGSRFAGQLVGAETGAFLGSLLVGLGSNLFARLADRPASVVLLPGLILLVPGSLGFRSVSAMVENDTLAGLQTAFTVAAVAISLAVGLLLANLLLPPRRAL